MAVLHFSGLFSEKSWENFPKWWYQIRDDLITERIGKKIPCYLFGHEHVSLIHALVVAVTAQTQLDAEKCNFPSCRLAQSNENDKSSI